MRNLATADHPVRNLAIAGHSSCNSGVVRNPTCSRGGSSSGHSRFTGGNDSLVFFPLVWYWSCNAAGKGDALHRDIVHAIRLCATFSAFTHSVSIDLLRCDQESASLPTLRVYRNDVE
jgi:hypothetical protein